MTLRRPKMISYCVRNWLNRISGHFYPFAPFLNLFSKWILFWWSPLINHHIMHGSSWCRFNPYDAGAVQLCNQDRKWWVNRGFLLIHGVVTFYPLKDLAEVVGNVNLNIDTILQLTLQRRTDGGVRGKHVHGHCVKVKVKVLICGLLEADGSFRGLTDW